MTYIIDILYIQKTNDLHVELLPRTLSVILVLVERVLEMVTRLFMDLMRMYHLFLLILLPVILKTVSH